MSLKLKEELDSNTTTVRWVCQQTYIMMHRIICSTSSTGMTSQWTLTRARSTQVILSTSENHRTLISGKEERRSEVKTELSARYAEKRSRQVNTMSFI